MRKKDYYLLLSALLALLGYVFGYFQKPLTLQQPSITASPSATHTVGSLEKVTKVIDGDTIEIEGGIKIRYIGIDTPETVDPYRHDGCFGLEATAKNKELVLGKEVRLEKDISETDKYGRLLRYVYVGDVMINNELVRSGFAKAVTYPPDVKYQNLFLESQKYARDENLGLWSSCNSEGK